MASPPPAPTMPMIASIPPLVAAGWTTICVKPSQFVDDVDEFPAWARRVREQVEETVAKR